MALQSFDNRPQRSLRPWLGLAGAAGLALILLPRLFPAVAQSLSGAEPKAYWYLARASGLVAAALLWLSMVLGLLVSGRQPGWRGAAAATDLHQYASLLSVLASLFHAAILLGDRYIGFTPLQVLAPFASDYQPLAVGAGQLALYALLIVWGSFYARRWIGQRAWRRLHYLSFGLFAAVLGHGLASGSDSGHWLARALYAAAGISVLALTWRRIRSRPAAASAARPPAASPARPLAPARPHDQPIGATRALPDGAAFPAIGATRLLRSGPPDPGDRA